MIDYKTWLIAMDNFIILKHQINYMFLWEGWSGIGAIGTMIGAIATAIYAYHTYKLLLSTQKANQASIYFKLVENLKEETSRKIFNCILNKTLKIENIEKDRPPSFTSTSVDRHLLNHIEEIAIFYKTNAIDIDIIDYGVGYQILEIGSNDEIRKHLSNERKKYVQVYTEFEKLYKIIYSKCSECDKLRYSNNLFD